MWLYKEGSKLEIEANEVEWYNLFPSLNSICFQLTLLKYAHGTPEYTRMVIALQHRNAATIF